MSSTTDILVAFELHAPEDIRRCLDNGVDARTDYEGRPLLNQLIEMYSRGPRFRTCMQVMAEYGAVVEDPALQAVLTDDGAALEPILKGAPEITARRYSLPCTFTPLHEVTLLHIAAEYGHRDCAGLLVQYGADVNASAGTDEHGFGGHTPVFHAVNQHQNFNLDILEFMLAQDVSLDLTVPGLIWGKGFEWETFVPSVNPISYAMMGLLRQFQRTENDVYEVVGRLMMARYGIAYRPVNLPNKYLDPGYLGIGS